MLVYLYYTYNLHNRPANGKQGPIPEGMSQTLLTNKKQENLDQVHDSNIIKPTRTHIDREKNTFCVKNFWSTKNI
jgi:hypothetical protein